MSFALSLIFFVSGASGLLFETLWFRLAGLTFGNSVWASSLVLAAFMGGLGLGNWVALRRGPVWKRPLLVYAGVEVVIGVSGYLLVLALPALTPVFAPMFGSMLEVPWLLQPIRLALAFVLLLVPSSAMGLTLPLLVKTLTARDANFGRVLGLLYGCNTLGAFVGALSGELLFIELLGLRGTGLVAVSLNLVAAGASFALGKGEGEAGPSTEPVAATAGAPGPFTLNAMSFRLLLAALLSGALLLGLEVVWFRFLQLFVIGTSLVFAVMLAVVLLGIGGGGLLASVWLSVRQNHYRHASLVALGAAALTAFTYIAFDDGFGLYSSAPLKPVQEPWRASWIVAGLCLPVSFLSGILFTFLGRALEDVVGDETRSAAALTFANTLGAMVGSLLAGFVLIPVIGVEVSLFLLGGGYLFVCLAAFGAGTQRTAATATASGLPPIQPRSRGERRMIGLASVAVLLLFVFFPFGLMKNHFVPLTTGGHMADGSKLIAMREGRTETAIYLRRDLWDEPLYFRLVTNGYSMSASTLLCQRYMRLYAYWPAILHRDPRKALLISYGLGVTAKALTEIDSLEAIDVVDISRGVLELSREVSMFPDGHPLDDPRVTSHVEDGRFFLQATYQRYDIITGEPPPPKNAGVVTLYTREYFSLLHDRLEPHGIATYWLPVYQLRLDETKAIAKAFCDAFSNCSLWSGAGMEWMLVGVKGELPKVSGESIRRAWSESPFGDRLVDIGLERPGQLGATFLGDAEFLADWTSDLRAFEDNYPNTVSSKPLFGSDEYASAMAEYERVMNVEDAKRRFLASPWIERHWPDEWRRAAALDFRHQAAVNRYFLGATATVSDLYTSLTESDLVTLPSLLMSTTYQEMNATDHAIANGVHSARVEFYRAVRLLTDRDYRGALKHLDAALRLEPTSLHLAQYRVLTLALAGETEAAREAALAPPANAAPPHGLAGFWEWFATLSTRDSDAGG